MSAFKKVGEGALPPKMPPAMTPPLPKKDSFIERVAQRYLKDKAEAEAKIRPSAKPLIKRNSA